jgi:hypothetical protein
MERNRQSPRRYQFPTRFGIEDQLIQIGPFSLSLRQALVLVLFGSLFAQWWHLLAPLASFGIIGQTLCTLILSLWALLGVVWTYLCPADRTLEAWTVLLLEYWLRPHRYVWRSREQATCSHQGAPNGEEEA